MSEIKTVDISQPTAADLACAEEILETIIESEAGIGRPSLKSLLATLIAKHTAESEAGLRAEREELLEACADGILGIRACSVAMKDMESPPEMLEAFESLVGVVARVESAEGGRKGG